MENNAKTETAPRRNYVIDETTPVPIRETYKSIRTNLLSILSTAESGTKQLCFTSPSIVDGKTLNCVNIAVTFAETGAKVLLIDADMRKPKLHHIFGISSQFGLSDYLNGLCTLEEAVQTDSKTENLFVLTAGKIPSNPTELILSDRFNQLLESLNGVYDYVFIDTPPAGLVTDAAIISLKTMGAVIVCRDGHTRVAMARKAKEAIESGGGRVICALLNGVSYTKHRRAQINDLYDYYRQDISDSDD